MRGCLKTLLLAIGLASCHHSPTPAENRTVTEMTTHMRTQGLGRYLIDLPADWKWYGGSVTLYYGVDANHKTVNVTVLKTGVTKERFQAAVKERARRIQAVTHSYKQVTMLERARVLPEPNVDEGAGIQQRIGLQFYNAIDSLGRTHELHVLLKNGTYVLLTADSYVEVLASFESTRHDPTDSEARVDARLEELSRKIRPIPHGYPLEAIGFGFILGPIVLLSEHDHEYMRMVYFDDRHRDIVFKANLSALTPDSTETVFSRYDDIKSLFEWGSDGFRVLRRSEPKVGGMNAQEMLIAGLEDGVHTQTFRASTYRSNPGFMRPNINLYLNGGGEPISKKPNADDPLLIGALPDLVSEGSSNDEAQPQPAPSSLTDYEATAIWDAILKSVRPRPGAATPTPRPWPGPFHDQDGNADRY